MRRLSSGFGIVCALVIGCSSPKPTSSSASVAPPPSSSAAPVAPSKDEAIAIRPGSTFAVHADVARMKESGWFKATLAAFTSRYPDQLTKLKAQCGLDPLEAVTAIAASESSKGELTAAVKVKVTEAEAFKCLTGLGLGSEASTGGRKAIKAGTTFFVWSGGVVFVGTEASLKEMLDQPEPVDIPIDRLALRDEVLRARALKLPEWDRIDLALIANTVQLGLTVSADATEERFAEQTQAELDRLDASAADLAASVGHPVALDFKLFRVARDGRKLDIQLGGHGGPDLQALYVEDLAAVELAEVGKYLSGAKTGEAKSSVGVIARKLVAFYEAEPEGGTTHRFPPTSTRVPMATPKATRYQSTPEDWEATSWKAIRFSLGDTQAFSYEFITAPDGQSVVVRAHGDLNGDGKESLFEVKITTVKGVPQISPSMTIVNELE